MHMDTYQYSQSNCNNITVVNRIQRMIHSNVRNSPILITYIIIIYGAIDDLYQKRAFFKIEIIFFPYVVLDKVATVLSLSGSGYM